MRPFRPLALLVLFSGCHNDALSLTDGAIADSAVAPDFARSPDLAPPPLVTITGTRSINWVNQSKEDLDTFDLSGTNIEALVPDGQGGFTRYPGDGAPNSMWSIPNVPAGLHYIHYSNWLYVITDATNIDLGEDVAGRRDRTLAMSTTRLIVNATNLAPWQSGDDLELYAENTGGAFYCLECRASNGPMAGDTALNGLTVDYLQASNRSLIDAGKGDVALLLQTLAQTTPNQNSYSVLGRMATLAPFTQMDGAAGMAMGAFIDQPMNVKQSIQWTRSAFTALRDSVTPNSITATEFLAVQAQPRGLSHGTLFYTARLLEVPSNAAATDLDLGTVQFANPFPASWGVAAFANLFVARTYAASASQPMTAYGEVWSEDEANAFFSKPVAPTLSPPSKPLVDGMDAFQDQMVATPFTITWQPPTLGTPTTYELILYHLISKQGVTSSQYVAEIHTIPSVTSITVPAELLINGERYYFMLAAENRAGVDAATQPLRRSYPRGGGELLSGTLTVSP